jgi:cobalt-zinc-cadmium efflux system protein
MHTDVSARKNDFIVLSFSQCSSRAHYTLQTCPSEVIFVSHSHAHHHHHHEHDDHEVKGPGDTRMLFALLLTGCFVVGETMAGFYANSLALLSDAAHNMSDVLALALSWYALRLQRRPAHESRTFGYHRAGILAAFINATTLVGIALWLIYEASVRLSSPPVVDGQWMSAVAALALVLNASTAWLVSHGAHHDLNVRSAFLHLLGDVMASLGAVLAGLGIIYTGALWLDPLVSILMGVLILWNARSLLSEVVEILLEGKPRDIEMSHVVRDILQLPGVRGLHQVHIWSLTRDFRAFSAHVVVDDVLVSEGESVITAVEQCLKSRYGIRHVTLQLEARRCDPDNLYHMPG